MTEFLHGYLRPLPNFSGSSIPEWLAETVQDTTQAFHKLCEREEITTKPSSGIKVIYST